MSLHREESVDSGLLIAAVSFQHGFNRLFLHVREHLAYHLNIFLRRRRLRMRLLLRLLQLLRLLRLLCDGGNRWSRWRSCDGRNDLGIDDRLVRIDKNNGSMTIRRWESIRHLREFYQFDSIEVMFANAKRRFEFSLANHTNRILRFLYFTQLNSD